MGGLGLIPGLGRSHGEGNGNPLQYSCPGPLLIATGESIPLRGLEGIPGLPGAPKDVLALESREGTRASRRVEEGLSRSLTGGGAKGCQITQGCKNTPEVPAVPGDFSREKWNCHIVGESALKAHAMMILAW